MPDSSGYVDECISREEGLELCKSQTEENVWDAILSILVVILLVQMGLARPSIEIGGRLLKTML